uniref:protein-tyrosine-phosphatase n=1 Tax=Globodera rostochiensis TaxID=31243 RepID=A0A914GZU8_GLORO
MQEGSKLFKKTLIGRNQAVVVDDQHPHKNDAGAYLNPPDERQEEEEDFYAILQRFGEFSSEEDSAEECGCARRKNGGGDSKKAAGRSEEADVQRHSLEHFFNIDQRLRDRAAIGPPRNIRVQTISNSSVVVQWDFDDAGGDVGGAPDGFMVKYMQEPNAIREHQMDKWRTQPVMDSKARHLEIGRLLSHKSYAFCVLAMKQRRLGPCSDPPVTIQGPLIPTFVVQNLRLDYKTPQSAQIRWDYTGPAPIGFYVKQMGQKSYLDQELAEKSMVSPQYEKRVNGTERHLFLSNLRPHMNYTLQVGVYSLGDGRLYWPRELSVQTDPRGPPFVEAPEFIQSDGPHTAQFRLSCASEEYGPISHYWLIVVPGNFSKEDMAHADPAQLQTATQNLKNAKTAHLQQITVRSATSIDAKDGKPSRKNNKNLHQNSTSQAHHKRSASTTASTTTTAATAMATTSTNRHRHHRLLHNNTKVPSSDRQDKRSRRHIPLDGVYIAAQIPSHEMQRLYREEMTFTIGDGLEYDGYINFMLDPDVPRYYLMSRAFAREHNWRRGEHPFDHRPPMQEPQSKMYTDSGLSEPFTSRASSLFAGPMHRGGIMFTLLAFGIILFLFAVLVGMLLLWWLRCKRAKASAAVRNKVGLAARDFSSKTANATGNGSATNGTLLNETSKLLLGMDNEGRPVVNSSYERSPDLLDSSGVLYPHDQQQSALLAPSGGPLLAMSNVNLYGVNGQLVQHHSQTSGGETLPTHFATLMAPIPLAEFATHIDRQKLNNNQGFIQEFESIDTGQHFTWENSAMEVNKHKNRYANVVAYDHSRVVLPPEDDVDEELPGNDYINGNYIDGYDRPKAYIATQGPLPETFADFWRMVWEERALVVVMLTRLEERCRTKCDQYWPGRGSSLYGHYKVTLVETTELAHYCLRTLRLENTRRHNDGARNIQHCQFTAWPDHGVPTHPTPFLMFLKRVKALNPIDAGPIITHCSAGIGRTGAFIVIDCMLERLRYENSLDIYGCVRSIRTQRSYMVQTDDQYIFIHDAVLDAAQSGSTEIPSSKLLQHVQTLSRPQHMQEYSGIDIEFNTLLSLKPPKCFRANAANAVYNVSKNMNRAVVPWDFNRVDLPRVNCVDGADYINASWVDGYRTRSAYMATQMPLANTASDFWRMLWVHECSIIAMVIRQPTDPKEKFFEYWPSPGYPESYNGLTVDFVTEFDMTHYWMREFKVTEEQSRHSRTIRQFQFVDWAPTERRHSSNGREVPTNAEKFVDFVRQVHQTKVQFGSTGPICVHCLDGAGRTGMFVAVSLTIDRAKLEHVVDMFTTVKMLRMQRPNMVESREQYEFCYMAAIEFLASYDEGF